MIWRISREDAGEGQVRVGGFPAWLCCRLLGLVQRPLRGGAGHLHAEVGQLLAQGAVPGCALGGGLGRGCEG